MGLIPRNDANALGSSLPPQPLSERWTGHPLSLLADVPCPTGQDMLKVRAYGLEHRWNGGEPAEAEDAEILLPWLVPVVTRV